MKCELSVGVSFVTHLPKREPVTSIRPHLYYAIVYPPSTIGRNRTMNYKFQLTNMVLAIMVAVEMDKRQLISKQVVVIKQVVAINNRNSSACSNINRSREYYYSIDSIFERFVILP
jgi:hypothetical protein